MKRIVFALTVAASVCGAAEDVKVDMGLAVQPEEKMAWLKDARIGMFIHWGLYAGPARGEWVMENEGIPIDEYRRYASPESGEEYFDAARFDPAKWMVLARDMGARYVCLTAQHHDGYALFESRYPSAFTSMQTHGRDFVREYVEAARAAGLRVGLYKTLINWRHPGYYDATGENCVSNSFGYTTAKWHKEDAREMKEELYAQTRELMSNYGKIDYLFWDGGWLAQRGKDRDAAFFWEPGMWRDEANEWPVADEWGMRDEATGRALGLMGMVRRLQPDIICNLRSGWCGDFTCAEGPAEVKGPVRMRRHGARLLMILQEAVGNALNHGKATRIDVRLAFGKNALAMTIADNGCGFEIVRNEELGVRSFGGLGMASMRRRAEEIGGELRIESEPGKGTTVTVEVKEARL